MIEKISVTNFKSHAHTEIELGRVTALVGPNGCGKTSVLQAVGILSQLVEQGWEKVLSGENAPANLVRQRCVDGSIGASGKVYNNFTATDVAWKVEIALSTQSPQPAVELHLDKDNQAFPLSAGDPLRRVLFDPITQMLRCAAYYKAAFKSLAEPSYYPDVKPQVLPDGSGLASAVAYLKTEEDDVFKTVEDELRSIVPSVIRIRPKRAKLTLQEKKTFTVNGANFPYEESREVMGDELVFDTASAKEIPAFAMSEGTMLTLGILTMLYNSSAAHLILLDDVEQGLHPVAQRRLMNVLKGFAEKQNRQVILTSHSPYIVDDLDAKDVWVMANDKQGISHCKRLSDHPDAERALKVLTTGELWDAEGEEWVTGALSQLEPVNA